MTRTRTSNALSWHYSITLCAVAGSFAMILPPTSSVAQTVQGTPAAYRAEASPPLDPRVTPGAARAAFPAWHPCRRSAPT